MKKQKRIYVPITDEQEDRILEIAFKERKAKSRIAAILLEDGLKLAAKK